MPRYAWFPALTSRPIDVRMCVMRKPATSVFIIISLFQGKGIRAKDC